MGTYLYAAVQQHFEATEYNRAHWDEIARFWFWKDYTLSMVLEYLKTSGWLSEADKETLSTGERNMCRYQIFDGWELPSPITVYNDGELNPRYVGLMALVGALGPCRVIFWRCQ